MTSCISLTKSSDKQTIYAPMDAVLKLLLNDVPGVKLKHEIVYKNSRLGRVFNLSSLLRGHKIIYVIFAILKHLL